MQLCTAVSRSHVAEVLPVAPASPELPALAFELPQLCCPAGHVGPQLALPSAKIKPMPQESAVNGCLYTRGR